MAKKEIPKSFDSLKPKVDLLVRRFYAPKNNVSGSERSRDSEADNGEFLLAMKNFKDFLDDITDEVIESIIEKRKENDEIIADSMTIVVPKVGLKLVVNTKTYGFAVGNLTPFDKFRG